MKKITLVSALLFVMMAFVCEKSKAQSQADPNVSAPANPDASQTADPNAGTETNQVTIDSTATGTTPESTTSEPAPAKSESATKIHIYSGKHDGNNVINPDPKN